MLMYYNPLVLGIAELPLKYADVIYTDLMNEKDGNIRYPSKQLLKRTADAVFAVTKRLGWIPEDYHDNPMHDYKYEFELVTNPKSIKASSRYAMRGFYILSTVPDEIKARFTNNIVPEKYKKYCADGENVSYISMIHTHFIVYPPFLNVEFEGESDKDYRIVKFNITELRN